MSGDGRDESLDGSGASASTGAPSGKVPGQGGPAGAPASAPSGTGGGGRPGPAGDGPVAVPQQRERGSSGSVLPPPRESAPSDGDLLRLMREGDDSAYEELFRRHSEAVRRYARSCCRDADTADDLTAEVFARTLQAVRGGAGPEHAVRAYLLTTVRRVAATWTKSAKREQLVEDFAVFAAEAARGVDRAHGDTLDAGADVRAMHEAERSLALQAFRSLPERWQAVLWHTTVEEESPSEVAPLFGLTPNATAVLASRAREGLKQAYLQAHVSTSLTAGGDCARYADRLGAFARGGLRMRAERGLRKHLDECARCRLAAGELAHVNAGIPALLPIAVVGWFAAGYSLKAAGVAAGGVAGAAGAGAAAAAAGGGASGAAAGGAVAEGLGAPAKAGIAAAAAVAATAGLVWAFSGEPAPVEVPGAKPAVSAPAEPEAPPPAAPAPSRPAAPASPPAPAPRAVAAPARTSSPPPPPPAPKPTPAPSRSAPAPERSPAPAPEAPAPSPTPSPAPPTSPAPVVYQVNRLPYALVGDGSGPEVRIAGSSWLWQRGATSIGGRGAGQGVTVGGRSSILIDLNRPCVAYEAVVGVDDLTPGGRTVRFAVYGDGSRVWRSEPLARGDEAVRVRVPLTGHRTLRLVVEPVGPGASLALADWAEPRITCGRTA
ncbi:sigma-70 family RNA polymerase sigma factor [Streptomyces sp. NPDC047968]|uniref:sigma-70 family RNA polymerase sigma factor n=1 Tax=unclassified Streptomyces TaxID=2593676 RepID=UPI00344A4A45